MHARGSGRFPSWDRARRKGAPAPKPPHRPERPALRPFVTTLWEYPSQHYGAGMQGDREYAGATPGWVVWQLLQRYTREGDVVLDPMCGSGTTLDVCRDLGRRAVGFDLSPGAGSRLGRADIARADARRLPLADASVDFVFIDPPYSTHIEYSDDASCIGKLDALGEDGGAAYYEAMDAVFAESRRVLRDERFMALYVSDSFRKSRGKGAPGERAAPGRFAPIGFELFSLLRRRFSPVDIVSVVRHNQKLERGNWRRAAEEGNFFLRGFNYLFIMRSERSLGEKRSGGRRR